MMNIFSPLIAAVLKGEADALGVLADALEESGEDTAELRSMNVVPVFGVAKQISFSRGPSDRFTIGGVDEAGVPIQYTTNNWTLVEGDTLNLIFNRDVEVNGVPANNFFMPGDQTLVGNNKAWGLPGSGTF